MSNTEHETARSVEGPALSAGRAVLLDPRARLVIGHRGNRAHAPENTLVSLLEAVALGVDAVEFDLRVALEAAGLPERVLQ